MIILHFLTVAFILKVSPALPLCAPASEWTPGWTASGTPPHWGKQCPSASLVTLSSRECCECQGRPVLHSDSLHLRSHLLWPRGHKWKVKAWSGHCIIKRRQHADQDATQLSEQLMDQRRPFQNANSADSTHKCHISALLQVHFRQVVLWEHTDTQSHDSSLFALPHLLRLWTWWVTNQADKPNMPTNGMRTEQNTGVHVWMESSCKSFTHFWVNYGLQLISEVTLVL